MTTFYILVHLLAKILLDNGDLAVGLLGILVGLQLLQVLREYFQRPVLGVGHKESQVDEMVGIGEVAKMGEHHRHVLLGISQRDTKKDAFLSFPSARGAFYIGQVVVSDGIHRVILF